MESLIAAQRGGAAAAVSIGAVVACALIGADAGISILAFRLADPLTTEVPALAMCVRSTAVTALRRVQADVTASTSAGCAALIAGAIAVARRGGREAEAAAAL